MNLEFDNGDTGAELDTKSPDAFRTISEVAEDLDIPQHVLRFWETRFAQIKPLKRGGGRRYYRPDDVALLKGIRRLLYGEGYTIKGLQRILKEQGARHVQAIGRGAAVVPAAAQIAKAPGSAEAGLGDDEPFRAGDDDDVVYQDLEPRRSADDTALLETIFLELGECRRILKIALLPPEGDG